MAIVSTVCFLVIAFFVGSQFMGFMNASTDQKPTDTLLTSEFVTAVEQGRVLTVDYDAGGGHRERHVLSGRDGGVHGGGLLQHVL